MDLFPDTPTNTAPPLVMARARLADIEERMATEVVTDELKAMHENAREVVAELERRELRKTDNLNERMNFTIQDAITNLQDLAKRGKLTIERLGQSNPLDKAIPIGDECIQDDGGSASIVLGRKEILPLLTVEIVREWQAANPTAMMSAKN